MLKIFTSFNTRLSRVTYLKIFAVAVFINIAMLIGCIIMTTSCLTTINDYSSRVWPEGYYVEEFDDYIDSLANDQDVHNAVKYTTITWFIYFLLTVSEMIITLAPTVNRLHDVNKSAKYLVIWFLFVFREQDIFPNQWGEPL